MRLACVMFVACCVVAVASRGFGQTTIYVDSGDFGSPYYLFYSDSGLTQLLDIYAGGSNSLSIGQTYTFTGGSGLHPFYLSNLGVQTPPNSLISLVGNGSATSGITGTSESFTLSFNGFDPGVDTLTYFCTNHGSMNGTLQVVPEPSTAILLAVGGAATGLMSWYRRQASGRRIAASKVSVMAALFVLVLASTALQGSRGVAAVVWDETTNGDASGDPNAPTSLALGVGANTVTGRMTGSAPADVRDYFSFSILPGQTLTGIIQQSYTDGSGNPGNRGFHAIIAGPTSFVPDANNIGNFLGSDHLDPLSTGTNMLPTLGSAPTGGQGFQPPLGAGTYTYLIQQTGQDVNLYSLDFQVVPEPAMISLVVTAGLISGAAMRYRRLRIPARNGSIAAASAD